MDNINCKDVKVVKRDGTTVTFDKEKISNAITKAFVSNNSEVNETLISNITKCVLFKLDQLETENSYTVEQIQDIVETVLMENKLFDIAKKYILYRQRRTNTRNRKSSLRNTIRDIVMKPSIDNDTKRENANINSDAPMGAMLKIGSETSKDFYLDEMISKKFAEYHRNGDIHIHDLDFYGYTTTCTYIDINKLLHDGFNTGHGYLREPQDIMSYSALTCIALQSNQNDQHGGQAIANFDYGLAPGVAKTFRKTYKDEWKSILQGTLLCDNDKVDEMWDELNNIVINNLPNFELTFNSCEQWNTYAYNFLKENTNLSEFALEKIINMVYSNAVNKTDKKTYQAMESLVHNLNTMQSRAGSQVPFSSVNYGLDSSPEGRMVIKNLLLATSAGLGNGETPIFPIHIFRVKEGINYNETDPNYDLFKLSMKVSAKRLFPNYAFIDAPFNLQYYKEGRPETEVGYMGCRTRVMGNVHDPERQITFGRGNLSFTTINLPRIGIESKGNWVKFITILDDLMDDVVDQLLERLDVQSSRTVRNFPFLMGQNTWIDSEKLDIDDEVREVLKHGTLSIGFIGLAETLTAMMGVHHGQSKEAQEKGLFIIEHMRKYLDTVAERYKLNFSLLATPAEGLSGRFVKIDRNKYGEIEGVTDKEYYTNSFHVPVGFQISAFDKIKTEAPYHELTNAGHISYVEMDGDPTNNIEAFEKIIRCMKESGIGYGSINHPVDRDPVCGYTGIINNSCPKCGRTEEDGIKFERIRRITGYLVGTLDRFNNAKRSEVYDRVKHN